MNSKDFSEEKQGRDMLVDFELVAKVITPIEKSGCNMINRKIV